MATAKVTGTKVSLTLAEEQGTCSYSKVKSECNDAEVYDLGKAINDLQAFEFTKMYRIIETEITE